jgi:hypothetical protein
MNRAMGKRQKWLKKEGVGGCLKGFQKVIQLEGRILRLKGVEHASDHIGDSFDSVASGIAHWLYDGWGHSYPAGHRHCRRADPSHSGTKNILAIWTLAGEGEVFGKEVFSRSGKLLPNLWVPSSEKVPQRTLSP